LDNYRKIYSKTRLNNGCCVSTHPRVCGFTASSSYKIDIQFSKWEENVIYVFDPRNKDGEKPDYFMVVYHPTKNVIARMKSIGGIHGIGIADDLQEILAILTSFYFEGDDCG